MQINFFKTKCDSEQTSYELFGIHDEIGNDIPAYLVYNEDKSWMLTIQNVANKIIDFHPIDNCLKILKPETKDKESLCDGFFTFENSICFIELAESKHKSPADCINQLKSTLKQFKNHHPVNGYIKKLAIVSNIRKISSTISAERQENFKLETGFNLLIKTKLEI